MGSIVLPDGIIDWLDEISKRKGVSKKSIIVNALFKSAEEKDLQIIIDNISENMQKKEIKENPELEEKITNIIKDKIKIYFDSGQIPNKLNETSKEKIIEIFVGNLIEPKVLLELETQEIDYVKKDVSKKIISSLSKMIDDYSEKVV